MPELGETFRCPPTFRVFAAQNPVQEGGGRKGLPKSFLNRFTRVHVEPMESSDLVHITRALYPRIPATVVERMVAFTAALSAAASVSGGTFARAGACGSLTFATCCGKRPIEATAATAARTTRIRDSNGRTQTDVELAMDAAERAVDATFATLFVRRLRTAADRAECAELFASAFGRPPTPPTPPAVAIRDGALRVGHAVFPCGGASANVEHDTPLGLLRGQLGALEAAATARRAVDDHRRRAAASGNVAVQTLASSRVERRDRWRSRPPRTRPSPRFVRTKGIRAGSRDDRGGGACRAPRLRRGRVGARDDGGDGTRRRRRFERRRDARDGIRVGGLVEVPRDHRGVRGEPERGGRRGGPGGAGRRARRD